MELEKLGYSLRELDKPDFENKNRKTEVSDAEWKNWQYIHNFFLFYLQGRRVKKHSQKQSWGKSTLHQAALRKIQKNWKA